MATHHFGTSATNGVGGLLLLLDTDGSAGRPMGGMGEFLGGEGGRGRKGKGGAYPGGCNLRWDLIPFPFQILQLTH